MQSTHLRPRRVSDILDTAFSLYRTHFRSFLTMSAVLLVPVLILQIAIPVAAQFVQSFQSFFLTTLLSGVLSSASIQAYWQRIPHLAASYQHGTKKYLSLFGASLLIGIIAALPALAISAALAIFGFATGIGTTGIAILLVIGLAPLVIFLTTKYAVVVPVMMSEGCGASDAMSRSWKLSTGLFWHITIVSVSVSLLTLLIAQLPALILGYVLNSVLTVHSIDWLPALQAVFTQLGLILAVPFNQLVATVLYYDLRVRNEGYDLEVASHEQLVAPPTIFSGA